MAPMLVWRALAVLVLAISAVIIGCRASHVEITSSPRATGPPPAAPTLVSPSREVIVEEAASTPARTTLEPTITILYDNTAFDDRLSADWGFAALIELAGFTLLFDTGGDGTMLLENLQALGFDPLHLDAIVLSHEHGDHVGGFPVPLADGSEPTMYLPRSFSTAIKSIASSHGVLVEVTDPIEIYPGVHVTGELGGGIAEQALVLETTKGTVVVTGCAHPGIIDILQRAKEITGGNIDLVVGGFHLNEHSRNQIESTIDDFHRLGVSQVVPTHCTGELAISVFAEAFGENFVEGGVGRVLSSGSDKDIKKETSAVEKVPTIESTTIPTAIPTMVPTPVPIATPTPLPSSILLEPMNHQVQSLNNCGPASVAILLGYFDHQINQGVINDQGLLQFPSVCSISEYIADNYGRYVDARNHYGDDPSLIAWIYHIPVYRNVDTTLPIRLLLANGVPVIVFQKLSENSDIAHYRVIHGFDDNSGEFIADDPLLGADYHIPYDTFVDLFYRWSGSRPIVAIFPVEKQSTVGSLMSELGMRRVYSCGFGR
jgi:7,8-dihydropterin-6-yl-methyl-4-(beta-D-ribofuranosyl)aminobenzene 5'-phosphate synthase